MTGHIVGMGQQLAALYAQAADLGGFRAKLQLAQTIEVPTSLVSVVADAPDLLDRANRFLRSLDSDGSKSSSLSSNEPVSRQMFDNAPVRYTKVALDLLEHRSEWIGDLEEASKVITRAAATTLDIERAGVWILESSGTIIRCVVTFINSRKSYEGRGMELSAFDYAPYFRAVRSEKILDADDAHRDPRTSCFSAGYLTPLNIQSMLDIPLWSDGRLRGVLCCEHVGSSTKEWTKEEQQFGLTLTQILSHHWKQR